MTRRRYAVREGPLAERPPAREIPPGTEEYKRIIAEMGGHKAIRRALDEHDRKSALLNSMWKQLLQDHGGKFVALTEGDEVFVARTLPALVKKVERKGKPLDTVLCRYLDPGRSARRF